MGNEVAELYRQGIESFGARVHAVGDDQWHLPTPCTDWDVRALVNHLVYEMRWAKPLFEGATIEEVGDRFEGDLLGDDPRGAWDDAAKAAAAAAPADMERLVHLSFGDVPGSEYAMQLHADLLVHGWDLARAIGGDEQLDLEQVRACSAWFREREEYYRAGGAVGPRPQLPAGADAQAELLAAFGRRA
ncbi:MAG TPA: TIGR03086 family metal-binding protein [Actinomycetes bacterium]